jgi:ABC-type oligopeptide transport system ATPase subunit
MYRGRLVESGPTPDVLDTPRHPYTQALISAVPPLDPTAKPFRVAFDASAFDPDAELREVAPAHWAAI